MNLKFNSITAQLYRWFYDTLNTMPFNFCPYFWKVVFMYVFIVPTTIFSIPAFILERIFGRGDSSPLNGMKDRMIMSFLLYAAMGIAYSMIAMFWAPMTGIVFPLGILFWLISIVIGLAVLIEKYKKKHKRSTSVEKGPNLIVEFFKAKYNKHCPQIDWKDD